MPAREMIFCRRSSMDRSWIRIAERQWRVGSGEWRERNEFKVEEVKGCAGEESETVEQSNSRSEEKAV